MTRSRSNVRTGSLCMLAVVLQVGCSDRECQSSATVAERSYLVLPPEIQNVVTMPEDERDAEGLFGPIQWWAVSSPAGGSKDLAKGTVSIEWGIDRMTYRSGRPLMWACDIELQDDGSWLLRDNYRNLARCCLNDECQSLDTAEARSYLELPYEIRNVVTMPKGHGDAERLFGPLQWSPPNAQTDAWMELAKGRLHIDLWTDTMTYHPGRGTLSWAAEIELQEDGSWLFQDRDLSQ